MSDERIYSAAHAIVMAGLATDGSVFTPGRPVWTAANARDLLERFVDQPDLGKGSFTTKLKGQLADAPPDTAQLMAELTYLHLLMPKDIGGAATGSLRRPRRRSMHPVWSGRAGHWMDDCC